MKPNQKNRELYKGIRDEIEKIHLVDAHNHLISEKDWLNVKEDWTSLLGYCVTDLVNAGLSRDKLLMAGAADIRWKFDYGYDYYEDTRSPEEKWEDIKPYWPYVRHMGSGDVTRTALKIFFDCDDLSDKTVPTIQGKLDKLKKPGAYKEILQKKGKIDVVCDVSMSVKENPPTEVIAPQLYTDHLALIQNRRDIYRLEQESGLDIYSFERYLKAIDVFLEKSIREEGAIGIKWHMFPYLRDMEYEISNTYDAAKCFDKILQKPARGGAGSFACVGIDEMRPFQNIVQNHLVQRAIELDVPVQVHAATLGVSYGGPLNGNPKALIQLFLRYPQARFNVLHAGFPWSRELGAISHIFPNVFINASWLDILSPESYKQFMKDWITGIPINKIFAYGADQFTMLLTIACIDRVKNMLAEIFTDLVSEGEMTEEEVPFVADCILRKNAWEHWKLADRKIPKNT